MNKNMKLYYNKDNKEEQAKHLMELYKEKGVNPFSGCFPILIQLPILIALYQVFLKIFDQTQLNFLYSFIARPDSIHQMAFGFINLAEKSIFLAVLAGVSQYLQALTMPQINVSPRNIKSNEPDMAKILSYQTKYFFPVLIVIFSWNLPAALPLYWTVLNLFAIVQQTLITNHEARSKNQA
jgi:YidC/Oxa1 family membrane protein insertase